MGNDRALDLLTRISQAAWQRLHFLGHSVFKDKRNLINLETIFAGIDWASAIDSFVKLEIVRILAWNSKIRLKHPALCHREALRAARRVVQRPTLLHLALSLPQRVLLVRGTVKIPKRDLKTAKYQICMSILNGKCATRRVF